MILLVLLSIVTRWTTSDHIGPWEFDVLNRLALESYLTHLRSCVPSPDGGHSALAAGALELELVLLDEELEVLLLASDACDLADRDVKDPPCDWLDTSIVSTTGPETETSAGSGSCSDSVRSGL